MEQGKDIFENQALPVAPGTLDFVLLTHAHIDHSGNLPLLYKNGFRGRVYATEATCSLCGIMSRSELIRVIEKLCGIVSGQAGEDGFRGGVRPGNISLGADCSVALGPGGKSERDRWTAEELEFMSPEEFWNGECGAPADVYSIGLVLYYCVNGGRLPFQPEKGELTAEDRAATLRRRMAAPVRHSVRAAASRSPPRRRR